MKSLFKHISEKLVINKNTKIIKDYEEVDLSLPSGLLWCKHNVGAKSETDRGLYFSWGHTEGHKYKSGDNFSKGEYDKTAGSKLTESIKPGDKEYDAATANMGSEWRMPTKEEFKELYNNTEHEWTEIDGVKGMKFSSKKDPEQYVFFPAVGYYDDGTNLYRDTTYGYYWSTDIYTNDTDNAFYMYFDSFDVKTSWHYCYRGYPIRAVKN